MKFFASTNARQYASALSRYANETGKSISQALAREGPEFRTELFQQFRNIHPAPDSIVSSAQSRRYRVRRVQSTQLVKTERGLSQRAVRRASEILGSEKSDWFRWVGSRLVPVRFSGRGRHRVLQGGRSGRRFAASALRAYQLGGEEFQRQSQTERFKTYGVRRLNLRALAVYLELLYRRRGAQGGTMAVQWLFKTWRRMGSGAARRTQLVQRSVTGVPIGTVDFEFNGDLLTAIVFNGRVPGTGLQADKNGILDRVFAARSPRLLNAIALHHAKVARKARLN